MKTSFIVVSESEKPISARVLCKVEGSDLGEFWPVYNTGEHKAWLFRSKEEARAVTEKCSNPKSEEGVYIVPVAHS